MTLEPSSRLMPNSGSAQAHFVAYFHRLGFRLTVGDRDRLRRPARGWAIGILTVGRCPTAQQQGQRRPKKQQNCEVRL